MIGKIYIIRNDLNNYVYIGSTVLELKRRFKWHYNSIYDTKKKHIKIYYLSVRNYKMSHLIMCNLLNLCSLFLINHLQNQISEHI